MRTEYQIDKRIGTADTFRVLFLFGHTAANGDNQRRMTALAVFKRTHVTEHTVNRMFTDGTSIKQDKISFVFVFRKVKTHLRQKSFDDFAIGHILLTTVCAHQRQRTAAARANLHNRPDIFTKTILPLQIERKSGISQ